MPNKIPIYKTITRNGKTQKVIVGYKSPESNTNSSKSSSGTSKSGSKGSTSFSYTSVSQKPENMPKEYKAQSVKANPYTVPKKYKADTYEAAKYNGTYTPGTYTSEFTDQINTARDKLINWAYDPLQDANYQALAAVYGARGNLAAKNSMADAAALNGGYGTSYATAAAQQARNQYNQELASMVPQLEQVAYNRAQGTYNTLMDADNTAYGRFRDTEGDRQWAANYGLDVFNTNEDSRRWAAGMNQAENQFAYNSLWDRYNALNSNYQWAQGMNQSERQYANNAALDRANLLNSYKQWAMDYNTDWYKWNQDQLQKAAAGSGVGGGRGRSGGGGSSGGGYVDPGFNLDSLIDKAQQNLTTPEQKKKKKVQGGFGQTRKNTMTKMTQ